MTWIETFRRGASGWARHGLDLLYPPRCSVCDMEPTPCDRSASGSGALVCDACRRLLSGDRPRCIRCAAPLPATPVADPLEAGGVSTRCDRCARRAGGPLEGLVVLGAYDASLREQVLRTKRPAGRLVAAGLARLLVDRHRDVLHGWAVDLVVPIPMHWLRRCLRGTSAADEMARWVGAGLGLPWAAALRRRRATRMQNELPWEERRANVHGAFRAGRHVAGRRLLLVDDVTTTGSTLLASAAAASAAGAAAVYAAVVARADRDEDS